MVGSWIGRSLVALPGLLASVGAGLIVAGITQAWAPSFAVTALLAGLVLLRVCALGVIIDLPREQVVLRTFWRTHRFGVDDLGLVTARGVGDGWPPGVRFRTADGREYGSMALCYLDEDHATAFIGQLRTLAGPDARVELEPGSFRPSVT